jgi:hypothetical protein
MARRHHRYLRWNHISASGSTASEEQLSTTQAPSFSTARITQPSVSPLSQRVPYLRGWLLQSVKKTLSPPIVSVTLTSRPSDARGFTVAIISTLRIELNAIEGTFDEFWDNENDRVAYTTASGARNSYAFGEIYNHHVVLAYVPGMGKAHGAAGVAGLRSSFPNVRLALLVGVHGGVPLPRYLSRRHHSEYGCHSM